MSFPATARHGPGALSTHVRAPLTDPPPGPPLPLPYLLVHGSMDRATSFRRVEARLPEAEIITYDRRGYAGSAGRRGSEAFADQVADLLEVLDGRTVVALGHSFGGDVVLGAAQVHPELIRAAVVWEPPRPWLASWPADTAGGEVLGGAGDHGDVAEAFMRRMLSDRIWERLPGATREARRGEGSTLVAEMRAIRGPAPWDPAAVHVPVLVGVGAASREHQRRSCEQLARALPHGELVIVAGAGHGAHLSHPADLATLLRRATALVAGASAS